MSVNLLSDCDANFDSLVRRQMEYYYKTHGHRV